MRSLFTYVGYVFSKTMCLPLGCRNQNKPRTKHSLAAFILTDIWTQNPAHAETQTGKQKH